MLLILLCILYAGVVTVTIVNTVVIVVYGVSGIVSGVDGCIDIGIVGGCCSLLRCIVILVFRLLW